MSEDAIQYLSLNRIKCDNQIRIGELDEQELIGLAITIREVGQLFPIRVRSDGDGYTIVDGHRRYLAMMQLKRPTIAVIVDGELNEGEALHRQWVSNCQRTEISPIERARAIQRLMGLTGWSPTETAKRLGITGSAVSRAISLISLPEPIIAKVEEGRLAPSTACELVKVGDPDRQAALAEAAVTGGLTRDGVSAEVKRQKNGVGEAEKTALCRAVAVLGGGRSVSVSGTGLTLDTLIASLESLLAKARKARTRGVELKPFLRSLKQTAET